MRSNKLNVWLILLGVSLLFVVFYYFLGKKFGIREGASTDSKSKKGKKGKKGKKKVKGYVSKSYPTDLLHSEIIKKIPPDTLNLSSRGEPVNSINYEPSYEASVNSNDYDYGTIKQSFGDLVDMAYEDHERLSRLEVFNNALAKGILEEEKIIQANQDE